MNLAEEGSSQLACCCDCGGVGVVVGIKAEQNTHAHLIVIDVRINYNTVITRYHSWAIRFKRFREFGKFGCKTLNEP